MFDFLKKTYLAGLGLASLTQDKVEEMVDELIKRGEIAEKDRSKIINDMLNRVEEEQNKLFNKVRDYVRNVVREMDLPTREEFNGLQIRIDQLEAELRAKQDDGPPA